MAITTATQTKPLQIYLKRLCLVSANLLMNQHKFWCPQHWATVRKPRNIYIHYGRVPLPEIYFSISEAFRPAGETEASDIEVTPALGRVEVRGVGRFSSEMAVVL